MIERLKSYVVERLGINRLADQIAHVGTRVDAADSLHLELRDELHGARTHIASLETQIEHLRSAHELHARIASTTAWAAVAPLRHQPLLSVVLATRNRAELLVDAVDSVAGQTYGHWELIVVDDGSDDSSSAVVSERASTDERIRLEVTDGIGAAGARNVGIAAATGAYVAFLDDDNVMAPHWLRGIAEYTGRHPDVAALYGVSLREEAPDAWRFPWVQFEPRIDLDALRMANHVDLGALAVRRDHTQLRFDEALTRYIDWELVVRLAASGDLVPVPIVASYYSTRASDRISRVPDPSRLDEMHRRFATE